MSEHDLHAEAVKSRWIVPMKPRAQNEPHRAATPLELFFDLVFVVAIAQAASGLHHGIADGHTSDAVVSFIMVFFSVWWAWMNFTWFASAYDNNDIPYRLLVFVQMTGALILAAGVEPIFIEGDFTITVVGYVVMRVAGIAQWLRAAHDDPEHRPAALRYAAGVGFCQVCWVLLLLSPPAWLLPGFIVLAIAELLAPVWAENAVATPWHPHHITERYGLFTIIVLGEAILSTSAAIRSAVDEGAMGGSLVSIVLGGLLIVYAMWWLYFYQPAHHLLTSFRIAFGWGYGHLFVFMSTAAVGAGLAVVIDQLTHHAEISAEAAGMAVALPVAVYVFSLWLLQERRRADNLFDTLLHPAVALLILLTPFMGNAVLFTGILLAALVVIRLIRHLE